MIVRLRALTMLVSFLLLADFSIADGTRRWEQSKFDDLVKGTADGVAIRSEGGIELAPAFKPVITTPSPYIWSIAADRNGNLYAATGTPARVYRITPDGKSADIFQSQELQVQALAVDSNGIVYAATNPDGKVYRLEPTAGVGGRKDGPKSAKPSEADSSWNSSVFFDPGSKYIWNLALDKSGNLFVATGDHGEIFRVTPQGDHTAFFKSDEAHIRVLGFDRLGDVIAGSDGSGLVYRILPSGEGFVLYSAPKKEITALAVDPSGDIYAAAAGDKKSSPTAPGLSIPASPSVSTQPSPGSAISLSTGSPVRVPSLALGSFGSSGPSATGGSEIYRISSDGAPKRIWTSPEDLVYALAFGPNGELLAGTGNRGHIFEISDQGKFTDLVKANASQVTAFAHASGNGLYASSSNLGKIFLLGASVNGEGTYVSDVFDAHIFSRWGRVEFRGDGSVELFARSGNVDNPDRNWSSWKKVEWQKDEEIHVPPARFIQWKAVLHAGNPSPRVESVAINYLSKNVAPDFDDLTVQEGVRFPPSVKSSGDAGGSATGNLAHGDSAPSPVRDRDSLGVRWNVHDDNDDDMVYSVYYRGVGDSRWLLLKENLSDKFYSFDSSLLPDGAYTIKVVASDAPSHSPGQGLTAERESARFEMDTTPPRIENLRSAIEGNQLHVTFQAMDSFSRIQKAEYSVDAGDWQLVEPVGQISDAKTETYDFRADLPAEIDTYAKGNHLENMKTTSAEHVVVVRVYDRHENMASAKTVIAGKKE